MVYKYYIETVGKDGVVNMYDSNSRNARKHLLENDAVHVGVFKSGTNNEVCRAVRTHNGLILVGAVPKN